MSMVRPAPNYHWLSNMEINYNYTDRIRYIHILTSEIRKYDLKTFFKPLIKFKIKKRKLRPVTKKFTKCTKRILFQPRK